jgi:hypothetical protein
MNKILLTSIIILAAFLRLFNLGLLPPHLTGDELSLGYNAYSILKDGVDQHGKPYPLWFEAYGEYKLPVYVYSTVVSLALFGNNNFAIRFPAALSGIGSVFVLYFIVKNLIGHSSKNNRIAALPLLSAFIFAISPWHVQLSRLALESVEALFLFLLACFFCLLFFKKSNLLFLICSCVFFILSAYTYNSYRILSPLILGMLFFVCINNKKITQQQLFVSGILSFFLFLPVLFFSFSKAGMARFATASAFSSVQSSGVLSYLLYPIIFIRNFLSYFSLSFLFTFQKENFENISYYISSDFGLLFHWQLVFLIVGIVVLLSSRVSFSKLLFVLLFLIPIPAALTISPHPLRVLPLMPVLSIIIAMGILFFAKQTSFIFRIFFGILMCAAIGETMLFAHMYVTHYPNLNEALWGSSKRIVEEAVVQEKNYSFIVVNKNTMSEENLTAKLYAPNLHLKFVNDNWTKPQEWNTKKVLYIYNGKIPKPWFKKHVEDVFLHTLNRDIVAQFWEI